MEVTRQTEHHIVLTSSETQQFWHILNKLCGGQKVRNKKLTGEEVDFLGNLQEELDI